MPDDCVTLPDGPKAHLQAMSEFQQAVPADYWARPGRLLSLIEQLESLRADGLEPANYYLDTLIQMQEFLHTWGVVLPCDAELASFSFLSALSDLQGGRATSLDQDTIWYSPLLGNRLRAEALTTLALNQASTPAEAFALARPTLPLYVNLRTAYQQALAHFPARWPQVPAGAVLELGDRSPRVDALRERLAAEDYLPEGNASAEQPQPFDETLQGALKQFQRRHYLEPDGKLGPQTLAQLNISPSRRLRQIKTNLERLRWLAADMEPNLLLVDIAAARIQYYRAGDIIWSGRAQVGQPLRETPRLKSLITHVTVNPTWTIPTSIFLQDQLPRIQRNPSYLAQRNIRIFNRQGEELGEADVDWNDPRGILLRQDAGPGNALGKVVIRFSNPFAVYLHDTPSSGLFDTSNRFYSSGCVRVENALDLTAKLFEHEHSNRWQEVQALRASGETRNVHLPRSVPVLLAYWTAEADDQGKLYFRPDTYQTDDRLLAELSQVSATTSHAIQ
ncbi:L,D-transpeptidase family protein [Marinobacter sp. SS21]|uniref:L,D-transpeptidase family protein n=1 Tax=Marinobacter sp. SS21 TaxID=2979460 RepID=UPI00232EB220|nr:L,D-transpeptidase family protein [Marinobacter sp. SS21]MDC0661574.1 L,D-transpeptidase family protein [Marinobacter sp. SS21]